MRKTHAGLNFYFKNNDVELNLYYNSLYDKLEEKTSVEINSIDIKLINIFQIKDMLSKFGLTPDEIKKILLIRKFNVINPQKSTFELKYGIDSEAELRLKEIIYGDTDVKLTNLELDILNKRLKKNISYDEYQSLPDDKKDLYRYKNTTDNDIILETYKFINDVSNKYKEYITYIAVNVNMSSDNAGVIFTAQQDMQKSKQITNLDVYKNINLYRNTIYGITSIPITMLNKDFAETFKDFDEKRFMTGLDENIINDWDKNIIKEYDFILSYEAKEQIKKLEEKAKTAILKGENNPLTPDELALINMPKSICKHDDNTPNMYKKTDCAHKEDLKADYLTKLRKAKPKHISIDDVMYLLDFMLDKI